MFQKTTVAQLREAEELVSLVAETHARVAEHMADAMLRDGVNLLDGPSALRRFAHVLRLNMATEFSVGEIH